MLKFILFTLEFPPQTGGVATLYQGLADYWPANDLTVLADRSVGSVDSDKIKYRTLLSEKIRPRWLPAVWQLWRLIAQLKNNQSSSEKTGIEVIVGQILPLGMAAYFLAKLISFKYTILLHGMDFSLATIGRRRIAMTKKILSRADKIICSNSFTANSVKVFAGDLAPKLSIVNPGIEPVFVRNPQRVKELRQQYSLDDKLVMLSLGRLVLRKGVDQAITAMPEINHSAPSLVYVVAGTGPEADRLKQLADGLDDNIKDKIVFLGKISNVDRWAWMELCDIFIMPSRNIAGDYEGFGQVYLEANLAGKPVVAGDSGGVRDAVINNVNGLLINPEDPSEIARAVIKLAMDAELRKSLGEQGKRRVVENFSAKKQTEKFYQTFL